MNINNDPRQFAPATQRNRQPILEVFLQVLPINCNVLELASGTGEHAAFFASHLSGCQWIPSDPNPLARASINAWRDYFSLINLHPALDINAEDSSWKIEPNLAINALVNINMIHISPWSTCLGLMAGANQILAKDSILYLYGPFKIDGQHTAPSNLAFDRSLQSQNSAWGVRNLEDVIDVAKTQGFTLLKTVQMPANNLSVVFIKS